MVAPENAFSVFGSHATKKNMTVNFPHYEKKEKNVYLLAQPSGMFSKSGPPSVFFS